MKSGFSHESQCIRSVEWYTPPWVFNELGMTFNLDPCHPSKRLPWVPAERTIDRFENGLLQPWYGRVWLNPPYGKETGDWMRRLAAHGNGIALVFSRTDCAWFHESVCMADAALFLQGRIAFVDGRGTGNSGAGAGSVMAAWGAECVDALKKMAHRGWLIQDKQIKLAQTGLF